MSAAYTAILIETADELSANESCHIYTKTCILYRLSALSTRAEAARKAPPRKVLGIGGGQLEFQRPFLEADSPYDRSILVRIFSTCPC